MVEEPLAGNEEKGPPLSLGENRAGVEKKVEE
jgi:hypothetical protein